MRGGLSFELVGDVIAEVGFGEGFLDIAGNIAHGAAAEVGADGDGALLVDAADGDGSPAVLDGGDVAEVDELAGGGKRHASDVGGFVAVGILEADFDRGVLAAVFGVALELAGGEAGDGAGKGCVDVLQRGAVGFELLAVDGQAQFGHALDI